MASGSEETLLPQSKAFVVKKILEEDPKKAREEEEEEEEREVDLENSCAPTTSKRLKIDTPPSVADHLLGLEDKLCASLACIDFPPPITHIYNPLSYAMETHRHFVHRYGNGRKKVVFLGMNPGPYGMAQNGVRKLNRL